MRRAGFTLIELILVLAILAGMVAFVAPSLSRSSRARMLEQEALRLVAVTEMARSEAISQGVAMAVFVDAQSQAYGLEAASTGSGVEVRKEFTLEETLHFETVATTSSKQGRVITFTPEGVPTVESVEVITITDKSGAQRSVKRDDDGWGYLLEEEDAA
jgi:type II secretion system protein H